MTLLSDTYSYYFDNSNTFQVVLFYMCPEKHDNKLKTLLTLSQIDERLFNTSQKKKKNLISLLGLGQDVEQDVSNI